MKLAIFGLTISSSWGNGHATLWRGLIAALAARGHRTIFFERDVSWYAGARDLAGMPGLDLVLYSDWADIRDRARRETAEADVAIVTSYCPDGRSAAALVLEAAGGARVFYDLDTPVTLARLEAGETVDYLPADGLGGFDLVLSYTGGAALTALTERLGARRVAPLYGSVDPDMHRRRPPESRFAADLSYLGTYAADRQAALETLFIEPARRLPDRRFLIGGALYPQTFPWALNVFFARHVAPPDHPAFYSSSRLTLNVTRRAMADTGYCPSGRLFEAAACGTPVLSDWWQGLDHFFEPGQEILIARDAADTVAALARDDLADIGAAARERTLAEHTAARRAAELEAAVDSCLAPA